MKKEEVSNQLLIQLAHRGIMVTDEKDIEEQVDKMVASIPAATRDAYPTDKYEAALAFADLYFSSMDSGSPVPPSVQTPAAQAESMPNTLTTAQLQQISKSVRANSAAKSARAIGTTMEKVLLDKPAPSTYLKAEMKIVPTCRQDRLAQYEKSLVPGEENEKAFAELKAAVENGLAVPIHISDSTPKTAGYLILTPSIDAGSETKVPMLLTTKKLLGFVATQLTGFIASTGDGTGLGCKLTWSQPRGSKTAKASVSQSEGAPRLRVSGRAEALKNESQYDIISVEDKGAKPKKGKLRTAASFLIDTGVTKRNGEPITRRVRLSGDASLPVFIRKTPEYNQAFPIIDNRGGIYVPGEEEAASLQLAQTKTAAFILSRGTMAVWEYGIKDTVDAVNNEFAKNDEASGIEL